ncbi:MAG: tol-pal system protein YbgF [Proteobacteria bacterium]|nr:tol-pal system protein YbgF [Pseudomonadota bacterium]
MMKIPKSPQTRLWQIAAIAALGIMAGGVGALADVNATQQAALTSRPARKLDADEVQARALEAHMNSVLQKGAYVRTAGLFGESDEEKAARLAKEQGQDAAIQQLNQNVSDLQDSVRRLTGQNEQLEHKLSDTNARIERMQRDFDYKICTMTAQQLGESASGDGGLPCASAGSASAQTGNTTSPNNAPRLSPPPGVLGTIPSNQPLPLAAPGSPDAGGPPPGATRPQFDAAMNMLSKAQYDEARAAFRNFADTYPKDELAPQAVYWVGDIAYVQKDYPNAARAFAEEIKKYGSSPRAPDSMLKLGQSLIALKQKQEGCTTLGALHSKYPQASKSVLAQAKASHKAAGCK